jgi:hypothetical protein
MHCSNFLQFIPSCTQLTQVNHTGVSVNHFVKFSYQCRFQISRAMHLATMLHRCEMHLVLFPVITREKPIIHLRENHGIPSSS